MTKQILVSAASVQRAAHYVAALQTAGVDADDVRVLTASDPPPDAVAIAHGAAGLVLTGGVDVDPRRYGEETQPQARVEVDAARDALEWALLEGARAARIPVWGVCRGAQVVNVFLGGSLWQDIPTQVPSEIDHYPQALADALSHPVRVVSPATALGDLLGREPVMVNSRHHQAVKELGPGLVPVAVAPDGLLEAFELPAQGAEGWWLRAVQWHPENLVARAQPRELWSAFAAAAGVGHPEHAGRAR